MKQRGKKYVEALGKIEKGKAYTKEEAIKLAKETSISKFDGSVEVAVRLNLDTKKADQEELSYYHTVQVRLRKF